MFFKILTGIAPVEVTNRARNVNRALHAAFDGFFDNGFQIILVFAEIRDGVDFVEIKFVAWRCDFRRYSRFFDVFRKVSGQLIFINE